MLLGTDVNGNVLLVGTGTDPSTMPSNLNGVVLTAIVLTDTQEAAYLALPAANDGSTFISGVFTAIPVPLNTSPNAAGFEQAVKVGVGGVLTANSLAAIYPLFFPAIEKGQWGDLQNLILDAQSKSVITGAQYSAIKAAATQYNIPITLP